VFLPSKKKPYKCRSMWMHAKQHWIDIEVTKERRGKL